MVQINLLVVFVGIIFSFFLLGSLGIYRAFYKQANPFRYWDTTGLAAANRTSIQSSQLLSELQNSYKLSIENLRANSGSVDGERDRRNALIDNFALELNSRLNATIQEGLSFNPANGKSDQKQYQNYNYDLIHSNYLPESLSTASKKYISTLISEDKVNAVINPETQIISLNDSGRLQISVNLLKTLVGDEGLAIIQANPEYFATQVTETGLDLETLPNGIKLRVSFDSDLDSEKTKLSESKIISTAQIRLEESITEPAPASPVTPPPVTNNPVSAPEPSPVINTPVSSPAVSPAPSAGSPAAPVLNQIEFGLLPIDQRAIIYDPTKAIDKNNPIRIVNTKEGGYSILFVGDDGYINVGIGDAKVSSVKSANNSSNSSSPLISSGTRFDSGILTLAGDGVNSSLANSSGYSIKMDTIPRGRTRYTTVDASFVVNGITIPPGFVIAAVKEPGTGGRPGLEKFESFRVYNQEGALVTYFGANALNNAYRCSSGSCINFDKFYTAPGTKHMGADIYEFFSVAELFPGKSVSQANQLWIDIQGDLERNTKLEINSANEPWQDRILKDLNDQEMVYLGHELRYESLARIKEIFGFQNVVYKDDNARKLDDAQFLALVNYANAKTLYWKTDAQPNVDKNTLIGLKQQRDDLKKVYEQSRLEFNNYLKYNTLPDWLKPKETVSPKTTSTGQSGSQSSSNSGSQANQNSGSASSANKSNANQNTGNNAGNNSGNKATNNNSGGGGKKKK